jgi:Dolichyl-phosphate-mannose-protein mannosyltransferase
MDGSHSVRGQCDPFCKAGLPFQWWRGYSGTEIGESKFDVQKKILRILTSVTLITLIAFSCRVAFVLHQGSLVPKEILATVPFENEAGSIAQGLTQGQGFCCVFRQTTGPTAWLAPVYPLLLAMIFKLFGVFTVKSFYVAALLNCIFSSLACLPVYFAGKRIVGIQAAVLAAWIWSLFPSGILMPFEWIWDTSLSALLAATLLWATLRVAETARLREVAAYAGLWGFALLTNPALGSLLPFLLGWIAYQQFKGGSWAPKPLVLTLALIISICLPWTIRNAAQFHRLIPLRSNFPFELWIGNNEIYDEHSREVNRISRYEQVHRYQELGETAYLAEKGQKAVSFIRDHPALTLRLAGRRVLATWLGTSSPWTDFAKTDSSLVRFLFFWNAVTVIGVLAAILRLLAVRSPFVFPLASYPLVFPIVYYFTQTSLRLRHPCDPVLALLLALSVFPALAESSMAPTRNSNAASPK